jgi:chromosome segregation protein
MQERLASLELQGYKTFAKQCVLQFPARITAIIGPNGSGKSNIADGIRWVLGEQSYSILRAKRTEDLIYSGSELRSRSGMAAVSIVFNNADGWLPVDYEEVVLTRRAYRDGQNEYLLNGQRVRLKDIHELLGKTGLGDHTYTIIGQGLVDVALSIKPDERRKLFEEAAGIGVYRSRKEEALKRLDISQRNLERASDIVDEIKPRLRSLERQAARFGEYQIVQENLQKNLRDWYGYHWYKAQEEIGTTEADLGKSEKDSGAAVEKSQGQQAALATLREKIQAKRNDVNALHLAMQKLHEAMQLKHQDLAILEERNQALDRSLQQLEIDKGTLNEVLQSDVQNFETLKVEIHHLETTLEDTQTAKDASWKQLETSIKERQNLDTQRGELQGQLVNAEKELVVYRSRQQDLSERLETFLGQKANHGNSLKELDLQEQAAREGLRKAEEALREIEETQKEIEDQRAKLNEERAVLAKQVDQNLTQINRLNVEKNKAGNRLDLLNQSQASLAGYSEGAKGLLKLAAQKKTPGMTDLASKLEIPQEYEFAIAAALGEALDVLVLAEGSDLEGTLQGLGREVTDRVAVTGLSWADYVRQKTRKPVDGVVGVASELVKTASGLEPVLERLLGDYLIVKDLSVVESVRKASPTMNLVTLAGEVYLRNGVALIGKVKTSGKVSYLRTHKELEAELQAVEMEFEKTSIISKSLQSQKEALQRHLDQLTQQDSSIRENHNACLQSKNSASLSLAKLGNQRDWLKRQLEVLEKESTSAGETLIKVKDSIHTTDAVVKTLMQKIDAIRSLQREKQTGDLQQIFSNLETEHKVLSQRLSLRRVSLKEAEQRLKSEQERSSDLEKRLEANGASTQEIVGQIKLHREGLEAASEQAKTLQSLELDPQMAALGGLENELDTLQAEVGLSQKDLSNPDRLVTHYQLELARQQEKLNALRSRIDDDFGLIELEYRNTYAVSTPLPFPDMVIETLIEVQDLPENIDEEIRELKAQIRRMGTVNVEAQTEYQEVKKRFMDLTTQIKDLNAAIEDIKKLVVDLDEIMRKEFTTTFNAVAVEFSRMFSRLFNGGSAKLILSDNEDPIEGGIEIEARLPGKREQGLVLLSGGERSLTAVALVFALLKISPTPFCILDEVDAMLDESNVGRFIDLLKDLSNDTQFILITHNRNTVQAADVIYGITMGKDGASQLMSLKLEEVDATLLK